MQTLRNALRVLTLNVQSSNNFHTAAASFAWGGPSQPKKWFTYNEKVYPPQEPHEERRPAFVCHAKTNFKYSPKRMWYIACLVRGMTVDEALKQLSYVHRDGAAIAQQTILEAQELALKEHNVEYKTNLWIAESFVGKAVVIKGIRRHARKRAGVIHYRYCHYFVRLEEGKPPKDYYYYRRQKSGQELLQDWMESMRNRRIHNSL